MNPLCGDDDPAVALRGRQVQDWSQGIDGPVELIGVETDHRQISAGPGFGTGGQGGGEEGDGQDAEAAQ
ncbi:hypothetical protein [Streptomyces sp. OspMP-M43]|uniref:hypothetical protein n=1 Tax=Streptomyces sp. OspMP-M43 TaxID=1839781 RepID=UPI00114D1BAB|nr:hypothetical protein [Streptomyces sp. OspMP-M43]